MISYKEGYYLITSTISILGMFTSLGFCCFDLRNRGLVRLAGDILEKLENENIFPPVGNKESKLGYIARDRADMGEGKKLPWKSKVLKIKLWIRGFQIVIGICFLAALLLPFLNSSNNKRLINNQLETIIVLNPEDKTAHLFTAKEFSNAINPIQENLIGLKSTVLTLEQKIEKLNKSMEQVNSIIYELSEHRNSLIQKTNNKKD